MEENRLRVPEEFFREEKREGFLVTEAMKRYWAASIKTVQIFADFCAKHQLKWWADWGTMLGAYRHGGMVPWDDDIDIGMLRGDYERFLALAPTELEGLVVDTFDNRWHRFSGYSVVNNHRATLFSDEVLDGYYACPFPAGFDLFVYDACPLAEEATDLWRLEGLQVFLAMQMIRETGVTAPQTMETLSALGYGGSYEEGDGEALLVGLGRRLDAIASRYADTSSEMVISYGVFLDDGRAPYLRREWYDEMTELPFEYTSLIVPRQIREVLQGIYGEDFMTPIQGTMEHNYPLYQRDIREAIRFLEAGGIHLSELPPFLSYIQREADYLGIPYTP